MVIEFLEDSTKWKRFSLLITSKMTKFTRNFCIPNPTKDITLEMMNKIEREKALVMSTGLSATSHAQDLSHIDRG